MENAIGRALGLATLILLSTLAGCSGDDATSEPASDTKDIPGIEWFKGDVNEAFALARQEDKPIYFYWGAVWCPPCQEIKHTVFKSPEFITLSKLFVPVYLDGDTARAQAAGERFGVKGYPTMIVFNSGGEEITRIPGGIDIAKYNSVLELSLDRMTPTKDLVQLAISDPGALTTKDFMQLAYYSWGQDVSALPDDAPRTLFKELAEHAEDHDGLASSRLYMQYLVNSVREDSEENPVRIHAWRKLETIIADDELLFANWDALAYWPEITGILNVTDEKRAEIIASWQSRVLDARHDSRLSTAEQLAGWLPYLYYHFENTDEPLPPDKVEQLQVDLSAANRTTINAFARQSVVNQMRYIYQQARMFDDARKLLLAELDKSEAPYYFMSSLGSLAERQENYVEAVDWYRRAYETSEGAATRFQWGASYVRALIRMQPEEHELILSTAESLFRELQDEQEVFTGRNFRVLRSLNRQLADWKEDATDADVEKRFVSHIETMCKSQPEGSLEADNCRSLVEPETGGTS